jgi:hypothetical protein
MMGLVWIMIAGGWMTSLVMYESYGLVVLGIV